MKKLPYKGNSAIDSAAFYCPYIPLMVTGVTVNTKPETPEVVDITNGRLWMRFRLRRNQITGLATYELRDKALAAFTWITENVPVSERSIKLDDDRQLEVIIFDHDLALMFKLKFV